ncbi:hypothetical protein BMS3Abin01_00231 [bacterium BMS3Abin01]|nr:hypothetical protein BMS3Abin01_00231 [bacterium BMS3Abin01]
MPNLPRTINRLKDPRDLWLFLRILAALIILPRKIKKKAFPDLLNDMNPGISPDAGSPQNLNKTVGFVDTLLKYRFFQSYGKCLLRSLLLFRFLREQGWPVEIHFGVRRTGDGKNEITGHSWLVLSGKPFLETESDEYSFVTTYSYPS